MKARQHNARARLTTAYITVLNIGVVLMFAVILWPQPEPVVIANAYSAPRGVVQQQAARKPVVGTAARVTVPSVGIDETVRSGPYDIQNKSWTIDNQSAFHADVTVPVNNTNGTSLIYGHADQNLFGRLPEVTTGAIATVYTVEGIRFTYDFESSRQVDPTDVSALTSSGPAKLLLQTCSGPFDMYRTLATFRLREVVRDV